MWVGEWNRHFGKFNFKHLGVWGWPKNLENYNNWKIPLHLTISAREHFLRARKPNSTWLILKLLNIIGVCCFLFERRFKISYFNVIAVDWPQQALVSSVKTLVSYVKCGRDRASEENAPSFEGDSWTGQENSIWILTYVTTCNTDKRYCRPHLHRLFQRQTRWAIPEQEERSKTQRVCRLFCFVYLAFSRATWDMKIM